MEVVLATPLPPVAEFESRLNSGVLLCQLGERFCPEEPMWKKVYDRDETKFKVSLSSLSLHCCRSHSHHLTRGQ